MTYKKNYILYIIFSFCSFLSLEALNFNCYATDIPIERQELGRLRGELSIKEEVPDNAVRTLKKSFLKDRELKSYSATDQARVGIIVKYLNHAGSKADLITNMVTSWSSFDDNLTSMAAKASTAKSALNKLQEENKDYLEIFSNISGLGLYILKNGKGLKKARIDNMYQFCIDYLNVKLINTLLENLKDESNLENHIVDKILQKIKLEVR